MTDSSLIGKVVLVLGASGIVGGAVARGLLAVGSRVIAPCRSLASRAAFEQDTPGGLEIQGLDAPIVDYATGAGLEELVRYIHGAVGPHVDHIFACLGGSAPKGPLTAVPSPELNAVLHNRVFSQVLAAQHLLPLVRPSPYSCYLVPTGRLGERCPSPEWAVYTVVNAAVYGVVSGLRSQVKTHRVQELRIGGVIRRDSETSHHQWPHAESSPASELVPLVIKALSGENKDEIVRWPGTNS